MAHGRKLCEGVRLASIDRARRDAEEAIERAITNDARHQREKTEEPDPTSLGQEPEDREADSEDDAHGTVDVAFVHSWVSSVDLRAHGQPRFFSRSFSVARSFSSRSPLRRSYQRRVKLARHVSCCSQSMDRTPDNADNANNSALANRVIIAGLNRCIEACVDGEKGYAIAAANIRDESLKRRLMGYSEQRAEFVIALQKEIEKLGGFAENQGSAKGAIHRGFASARVALEGRTDAVILGECERGELAALAMYDDVLAKLPMDTLPPELRILLVDQRAVIKLAHDEITRHDLRHRASSPAG